MVEGGAHLQAEALLQHVLSKKELLFANINNHAIELLCKHEYCSEILLIQLLLLRLFRD